MASLLPTSQGLELVVWLSQVVNSVASTAMPVP